MKSLLNHFRQRQRLARVHDYGFAVLDPSGCKGDNQAADHNSVKSKSDKSYTDTRSQREAKEAMRNETKCKPKKPVAVE
ncbi:unnamed protein product [Merluccius merluccius]